MNRAEFLRNTRNVACAACATLVLGRTGLAAAETATPTPIEKELASAKRDNEFINNWLSDLFDAIDAETDPRTQLRLIEHCGKRCFERHQFKRDIAEAGKGDLDKLLTAYRKNFNLTREGDEVHIRYGGGKCYCPAARNRPARPNDLHCECTRATHQAVFQTALGRSFKAEIVESVRRGGKNCHIVVHLT